jgi:selenocysteine-specific elongation factor
VTELLKGTGIEGAPIVPVSSKSGLGIDELRVALDEVAVDAPSKHANLPMRLPVDRVFTIAGAGTVVTGTMWSGVAAKDDLVEIYPGGVDARVRGVQVHSTAVERAHAGQRVAMNVAGVERDQISRGDIIAAPGTLTVTDRFDARFTYLGIPGDDRPFESGARVHVNHGTREVLGRVLLMDGVASLNPGQSVLAQVRLEEPLAPRYDDRFIVRSYSPVYTIGGGVVLDALPPRRTNLRDHERALLDALLAHDLSSASVGLLAARALPMSSAEVAAALGVPRPQVADELNKAKLERLRVGTETAFITSEALEALLAAVERELLAFHAADPKATGLATSALRDRIDRRLSPKAFDAVLEIAVARKSAVAEKGQVRHPKAAVSALAAESEAETKLLSLLRGQGLAPDNVAELAAAAKVDAGLARKVLGRLATNGEVVRVSSELHFSAEAMERAKAKLVEYLGAHPEGAPPSKLREVLDVSRKYALPVLEYFDTHGVTKREENLRRLRH